MNICIPRNADENKEITQKLLVGMERIEDINSATSVFSAIYLDEYNSPIGGLFYYGLTEHNVFISLHIYQPNKVTKEKIRSALSFAFEWPLQIYRITALVSSTNRRSIAMCKRFGFHKEGECVGLNGSEDDVTFMYRYTQKDWYGSKYYGKLES